MPGPLPKPPGLRSRRNRASTRAVLPTPAQAAEQDVPPLPPKQGKWHERVIVWWERIWRSPMAAEYLEADKPGLEMLAMLHQAFWTARSTGDRFKYAGEIRLQEVRYGLDPISRRRLEWEVEKGEAAAKKTATRRRKQDPRTVLKLTT